MKTVKVVAGGIINDNKKLHAISVPSEEMASSKPAGNSRVGRSSRGRRPRKRLCGRLRKNWILRSK